jgi:rod shape-determining protein MreB and related proteins
MANSFIGRDMAVDLGTANTLVYVRGKGVLVDEPSVVALHQSTGEVLAVGHEAKTMLGRTPDNITTLRPLKDGVIADFEATEQMLRWFIQQVHRRRYFAKPRMVICVPSGITAVEQRAVKEAGYQAGARRVYIVEEPMAAAIGAGLPVHLPTGNMVVDVGGGTTEVAVISLGGIVTSLSVRTAGDDLDNAIVQWMKKEHSLLLGERTAEEVKVTLGNAFPMSTEPEAEIRGRDLVSGLPRTVTVSSAEIRKALEEPLHDIVDAVRSTLDQTPPELAGDIMDRGIVLTGGGALLRGLDERLRHETGMPVHVADSPLTSVAMGAGRCVEEFEALRQVLVADRRGY